MWSAPDHAGDAHIDVVDHHTHLVHGLAKLLALFSGAHQNEIFHLIVGKLALAENGIEEFCRPAHRHFEADRRLCAWRGWLAVAARAAYHAAHLLPFRAFYRVVAAHIFFGRATAQKGASVCQKLSPCLLVKRGALRLVERPFVPVHAQPLQSLHDAFDQLGLVALGVGVFDAQNHGAALFAGE